MLVKSAVVVLLGFGALACGGGNSGGSPTAPTAAAPAGCSGTAVPQVEVNFGGTNGAGMLVQLFGETFDQQIPAGDMFRVTRAVVPCTYEVVGQMRGRTLSVGFSRTSPFERRGPGVEKGSVVIDEGPNGAFGPADLACRVDFNASGSANAPSPPFNIRIRFRVATSNAVDDRGGGCG